MAKRIVVCVSGGVVQAVLADDDVEVTIVDDDEYKENHLMTRDVREMREKYVTQGLTPIENWGLDIPDEDDINKTVEWANARS
jgi:hypothetical protein